MIRYDYIPPSKSDVEGINAEKCFGECWNCKNHIPWIICKRSCVPLTYPIHGCFAYVPNLPDSVLEKLKKED